jgi:hypothetical protein
MHTSDQYHKLLKEIVRLLPKDGSKLALDDLVCVNLLVNEIKTMIGSDLKRYAPPITDPTSYKGALLERLTLFESMLDSVSDEQVIDMLDSVIKYLVKMNLQETDMFKVVSQMRLRFLNIHLKEIINVQLLIDMINYNT